MDAKTAQAFRLAAGVLVTGSAIGVMASLIGPGGSTTAMVSSSLYTPAVWGELAAGFLTVGSFSAVLVRQWPKIGWLGIAGLALVLLGGFAAAITQPFFNVFAVPWMAQVNPAAADAGPGSGFAAYVTAGGVVLAVGAIVFGVASWRAGVLGRWAGPAFGALFIVGSVLVAVGANSFLGNLAGVAFYLGLGLMGAALWSSVGGRYEAS